MPGIGKGNIAFGHGTRKIIELYCTGRAERKEIFQSRRTSGQYAGKRRGTFWRPAVCGILDSCVRHSCLDRKVFKSGALAGFFWRCGVFTGNRGIFGQTLYLLGRPAAVFIYKSGELLEGSGILKQDCYQISCEIHFGILYPYFGSSGQKSKKL